MDDLTGKTTGKSDDTEEMPARWKRIADTLAEILGLPSAVIMKADPSELKKNSELLKERVSFENLITDLSASLVNTPPERVDDVIAESLHQICRFFDADHCSLLEVLPDTGRVHVAGMAERKERLQKGLRVDIDIEHPWTIQRIVERGEPVVFSSLEELPPEASVDRAAYGCSGTRALLGLPLRVGGRVTYLIELRSRHAGHEWPKVHISRLLVFGEMLANVLIHKRDQEALIRGERVLAEAERVGHLGSWIWDIQKENHQWSDEFYRIFGFDPGAVHATYEAFLASVHPDDRKAVDQANREAISDPGDAYSIDYRVVRPDGSERVVHARSDVLFDENGKPVRMIGTLYDITERKRAEEALEAAFDEIKMLKEQLEAENIYLREEVGLKKGFTEIVGGSDSIKYVMHRIRQVAPTRTTVLLEGETGTGKELFARLIHEASGRREQPFVNVNCAGLPPNLIESELFGREKGAFTGATVKQIGRFELADGGTIFLDEIAELPLELQAKLLKVIEDGEFERLGSPHSVKVDVRIIASTNRNLEEEISKGRFRKDLFYRLSVFPVTIPPLRQREGDIALLLKFFAERFGKRHGRGVKHFPQGTMKTLERYEWPGNVRELMNVVERAVIVSEGPELRLADQIGTPKTGPVGQKASGHAEERETKGLVDVEREHILKTLRETGWRIEGRRGAAEIIGMNPSTMRARMRKLGIKRPKTS
ncbi:MAG TPA: sigma 54-interacting transcriptional regulator [Syntrophales bacterium]|nr:sigma 54-interacting transcriptional regulator [Syntrophales bacterium]HPI56609.1 sigma 54-interacting transcriptional regulator [Syntrophales bacterium]HPN24965.1 sigma 54-interacting transcriptional regulator [Syntrophales bacterium]HQM29775.1 sigma 54-interacting transcriptional regulator [Syntrophales bacterium]